MVHTTGAERDVSFHKKNLKITKLEHLIIYGGLFDPY